ncbi:MAG: pectinesterase family protein, partial [Acidobacteriota bacterium]|nr:pectinesterase family protein [Acidobacteriota bacterium]
MNELPRQKLIEIVARYGREVVNNPRRCEGLLRDYAPKYRREIAVLVNALAERVPAELIAYKSGTVPRAALLLRMAQRLHDDVALDETAARWAVESWALALGVINSDELAKIERPSAVSSSKSETPVTKNNSPAINKPSLPNITPPSHSAAQPKRSSTGSQAGTPTGGVGAVTPPASINPKARDTIIVSAAGDGEFLSIAEALRHASSGARVLVRPGLYRESISIKNQIEIVGDGALESIIIESTDASCLSMYADAATVRNLTLRGISA